MLRILVPAALVVGISLISQPASAQPLSLAVTLPTIAALLGLAVLGAALYWPKRRTRTQAQPMLEGQAFLRLQYPQPTACATAIEVVTVFAYDDPQSFHFAPLLARWARDHAGAVHLVQLPVTGDPRKRLQARVYYAARLLGVAERLHGVLFDALHLAKRDLGDEDQLTDFFAANGVDPAAFRQAFHSSAVQTALHKAQVLNHGYNTATAPALIVNGCYKITPQTAATPARWLAVLDHLVAQSSDQLRRSRSDTAMGVG